MIQPKQQKRMLRTHVDYANLSDVEKQVKKLYPFYTYTSRITGETARKLVSEPRRLVGSMKAFEAAPEIYENPTLTGDVAETDSTYIPKRRRENFAVPISSGPEGLTTFGNIDLPGFREINRAFSDGGLLSMTTDIGWASEGSYRTNDRARPVYWWSYIAKGRVSYKEQLDQTTS